MNTRVQVEHPVTELITGIDIVQQQIFIAAGRKLAFRQRDIAKKGHAIECRINAEDPYTFVPSPGRITSYHAPGGPGIRVDSHVYQNYFVPPNYDSMVGKVIAYGDTREQAMARMRIALSEMVVEGIKTNIPLHQELLLDDKFLRGGTSIHFLEERMAKQKSGDVSGERGPRAQRVGVELSRIGARGRQSRATHTSPSRGRARGRGDSPVDVNYIGVRFDAPAADAEAWSDALLAAGALSVDISDPAAGTPEETPQYGEPGEPGEHLWPISRLAALFAPDTDALAALRAAAGVVAMATPAA